MLGNWLEQIGAVTLMNLRNLRERLGSTLVALVRRHRCRHGRRRRAVDQRGFPRRAAARRRRRRRDRAARRRDRRDDERFLAGRDARDCRRGADRARRQPAARLVRALRHCRRAAEVDRHGGQRAAARVSAAAPNLRQDFEITEGRMFTPGTFEVIVGRGAALGVRGTRRRRHTALGCDGLGRRGAFPRSRQRRGVGNLDRCERAAGRLQPRHELPIRARAPDERAGVRRLSRTR